MNNEERKKRLILLLIIITFIIILIAWRFYLKFFPGKKDKAGDTFLLELINKGGETKENFQKFFQKIKNLAAPTFFTNEFINEMSREQGEKTSPKTLTNEEAEKLKEKILEYIDKEKE